MNYAYSRNALKDGLIYKGFKKEDKILLPYFICEAITHVLEELEIIPIFYSLDDRFKFISKFCKK